MNHSNSKFNSIKSRMEGDKLNVLSASPFQYGEEYDKHLFEQYKIYLEMADRISARRMLANSFFVSVNTALVAVVAMMVKERVVVNNWLIIISPLIAVLALCYVWYEIIRAYRQLNSGKFQVIHEIEKILPIKPYHAEWIALRKGEDKKKYFPLSHIEKYVPILFAVIYVSLSVALFMQSINHI